jgi:hypothetical protein
LPDDVTLKVVSGGVHHDNGRRRLTGAHEEMGLDPSRAFGCLGERDRQGDVQAEVSLGVSVSELPPYHERLFRPTWSAGIQRQGACAVNRDVRRPSNYRRPGDRLIEDGIYPSTIRGLLVKLAVWDF